MPTLRRSSRIEEKKKGSSRTTDRLKVEFDATRSARAFNSYRHERRDGPAKSKKKASPDQARPRPAKNKLFRDDDEDQTPPIRKKKDDHTDEEKLKKERTDNADH